MPPGAASSSSSRYQFIGLYEIISPTNMNRNGMLRRCAITPMDPGNDIELRVRFSGLYVADINDVETVLRLFSQRILHGPRRVNEVCAITVVADRQTVYSRNVLGAQRPLRKQLGQRGVRHIMRLAESRPKDLQWALAPFIDLVAQQLADGMEEGIIRQGDA